MKIKDNPRNWCKKGQSPYGRFMKKLVKENTFPQSYGNCVLTVVDKKTDKEIRKVFPLLLIVFKKNSDGKVVKKVKKVI